MRKNGKFILFSVDEFDAWLATTRFGRVVTLIQNHHTYQPDYGSFTGDNHFSLLAGMERFHVVDRGFAEIAQNLTTFPDGTVAVCRSLEKIPAGIKGANQSGVCIEHLGNFDAGGDTMSEAHRQAIIRVNALLCREFLLTPTTDTIVYHHWYDLTLATRTNGSGNTKSCPGTAFFGGNSVAAAQAGFIPQVHEAFAAMAPITPVPEKRRMEVTARGTLNVRAGAGTSFARIKQLQSGVVVQVYEEANGWCRIHPSNQQWVSSRYLRALA